MFHPTSEANDLCLRLNNTYTSTNTRGSHYFFTFQFYRFREVTTERLVSCQLGNYPAEKNGLIIHAFRLLAHSGREWRPTEPAVLKRIDENNRLIEDDGNGFMVREPFSVRATTFKSR